MHPAATQFVVDAVQRYGPFPRVLEIGSRDVNGSIRSIFMDHGTEYYVGVDIEDGPGVDLVMDFSSPRFFTDHYSTTWVVMGQVPKYYVDPEDGVQVEYRDHFSGHMRFDAIVCVNVLEHTPKGEAIFANAYKGLYSDGLFIMSCASSWPAHSAFDGGMVRPGEHYANVSEAQVKEWGEKAGFMRVDVSTKEMDVRCLAWK